MKRLRAGLYMIAQMAHPPSCAVALGAPEAPQVPTRYTEPHLFSRRSKLREHQGGGAKAFPAPLAVDHGALVRCSNGSMASIASLQSFGGKAKTDRVFFVFVLIGLISCTLLSGGAAVLIATQLVNDATINVAEAGQTSPAAFTLASGRLIAVRRCAKPLSPIGRPATTNCQF
jgi:hypothetical protein